MNIFLNILSFLWKQRCIWAIVFFVALVGFIDENSVMNLVEQYRKNAELKAEITKYENDYDEAKNRLTQLANSQAAVEEVARVNLLMKSNDEDVYIVEEEQ